MNTSLFIAQSEVNSFSDAMARLDMLSTPEKLLSDLAALPLVGGLVIFVVGVLCVLYGYKWHKWVVVALAFMLGLLVGHILSQQIGKSLIVAMALGILFATIATPMLRWTVAVFGGLTGAFLGANAWTLAQANPPDAKWAGAAMGFIALALMSFVLFRIVVVLFTSIGGAAMMVLGGITLLMQVPGWKDAIQQTLSSNQRLIPLLVMTAAVAGFVIQESRARGEGGGKQAPAKSG